jgi:uncharacterized membrane protein
MSAEAESDENRVPGVERMLTLSDAVVAIALTLLVLQLRLPAIHDENSARELAKQLGNDGDQLISYVISFYVIAQYWLAHHRAFRYVTGQRPGLAWWNFGFLFTITIMPFTSNLLGKYSENPLAVDIFALNLLLASLAAQGTTVLARRQGLLAEEADQRQRRTQLLNTVADCLIVALSLGVAWVSPTGAKFCWLLFALTPGLIDRMLARQRRSRDDEPGRPASQGEPRPG